VLRERVERGKTTVVRFPRLGAAEEGGEREGDSATEGASASPLAVAPRVANSRGAARSASRGGSPANASSEQDKVSGGGGGGRRKWGLEGLSKRAQEGLDARTSTGSAMASWLQREAALDRNLSELEARAALARPPTTARAERIYERNPAAADPSAARLESEGQAAAEEHAEELWGRFEDEGLGGTLLRGRFNVALRSLQATRPFFRKLEHEPRQYRRGAGKPKPRKTVTPQADPEPEGWSIKKSVFGPRAIRADAKDYFDTEEVAMKRLALDWKRVCVKKRFRAFVAEIDEDSGEEDEAEAEAGPDGLDQEAALDQELAEVHAELAKHETAIYNGFAFFCVGAAVGEAAYSLKPNSFKLFCGDCEVNDEYLKQDECDKIFVECNVEEEADDDSGGGGKRAQAMAEANDDGALMRFEFLEAVTRLAIGKYMDEANQRTKDVSEAIKMICEECIKPCLSPEASIDRNVFRRERLYCEEVDKALKPYMQVLRAVFSFYRALARKSLLPMEQWLLFLNQSELAGPKTGVSIREGKLVFLFSQLLVVDEINSRERLISMTFFDFLEGVCRMADLCSPVDQEELDSYFARTKPMEPAHELGQVWEFYERVPADRAAKAKRDSAELMATPTRPLAEKLPALLGLALGNLCQNYKADTFRQLAKELATLCKAKGGTVYTEQEEQPLKSRGKR